MNKLNSDKPVKYTARHQRATEFYFDPNNKKTFGNLYASALEAGFSKSYSKTIHRDTPWINDIKERLQTYGPDHIYRGFQDIAINGKNVEKLKALELMGKAQGMFIDRVQNDTRVTFVNDVPRPENEVVQTENEVIEGETDAKSDSGSN